MAKIINFIKKNYILCTIFLAIVLVIIGSIIVINIVVDNNKIVTKTKDYHFYEYFENKKTSFKGTLKYENDQVVSIKAEDFNIYEDSFIYYEDKMRVILPKDMSIVFYFRNNLSYKLPKYSEVASEDSTNIIYTGGKKYLNDDFFLYDGEDLYFFISDTNLNINGMVYPLSKYSYVYARGDELLYYNHDADEAVLLKDVQSASVKVKNVGIDLLNDATVENNKISILNDNIASLGSYKED